MNKTFKQLKINIGNRVHDTSDDFASLIGYWINDKYRDILTRYDWDELYFMHTINTSASVSAYVLPIDADKIMMCMDSTNGLGIDEVTQQQFYYENADIWDTAGTPDKYFNTYDVVRSQPASAEKLTVKSSAADTDSYLQIRGEVGGVEISEEILLQGTAVASAANSYTRITGLSKSDVTDGYITVYENDESTILSIIPSEQVESSYKLINFHPVPTGALTYGLMIKKKVAPLARDYDYPIVRDIADAVEYGAAAEAERYKKQFSKAQAFDVMYEKTISERVFQRESSSNRVGQFLPTAYDRDEGI